MKLLKLKDLFKLAQIKFLHKYFNGKLPDCFQSLSFTQHPQHQYHTRHINIMFNPIVRHEFAKKSIRHYLPKLLLSLQNGIKAKLITHSLKGLCNYVKNYILLNYSNSCIIENCFVCAVVSGNLIYA